MGGPRFRWWPKGWSPRIWKTGSGAGRSSQRAGLKTLLQGTKAEVTTSLWPSPRREPGALLDPRGWHCSLSGAEQQRRKARPQCWEGSQSPRPLPPVHAPSSSLRSPISSTDSEREANEVRLEEAAEVTLGGLLPGSRLTQCSHKEELVEPVIRKGQAGEGPQGPQFKRSILVFRSA